jgi:hypothetical protein
VDVILATRYLFIFRFKNPASINDDFWITFLTVWIGGFSMLTETIFLLQPGRQPLHIYVCLGGVSAGKKVRVVFNI